MNRRRSVAVFLLLSGAISWSLFALPLLVRGDETLYQTITLICFSAAMWGPGLAALLTVRFVEKKSVVETLGLNRLGPKKLYLAGWGVAVAAGVLTFAVTLLFGTGSLGDPVALMRDAVAAAPGSEKMPAPEILLGLQLAAAFTVAPFINTLFAMGEELGWRGFLQPRLIESVGTDRGLLLTGAIWGFWHAPAIALHGHNFPGHPIAGVFVMIVGCMLLGVLFGRLTLRSGTPWTAGFAHGAFNAIAPLSLLFLNQEGLDKLWGGNPLGISGWIALSIAILFSSQMIKKKQPVKAFSDDAH